jgi:large subunit ribosomal protein L9
MEVILLEKTGRFGSLGDTVNVKGGYGRHLVSVGKALRATKENKAKFERERAARAKESEKLKEAAVKNAEKLAGRSFVIIRQAGDTGHLFGSVSSRDVAAAVATSDVAVDYTKITIDSPIKELGIYKVKISLHPEVVEVVKINVARTEEEAKVAEEKAVKDAEAAAKKKAAKKEAEAEAEEAVEVAAEAVEEAPAA